MTYLRIILVFLVVTSFYFSTKLQSGNGQIDPEDITYKPNWIISEQNGKVQNNTLAPVAEVPNKTNKTPLILIHGVVSDFKPYCNWKFLIDEINKPENKEFADKHPIYIFRYSSSGDHWNEGVDSLNSGIQALLKDYPEGTKVKVVTSSLGGCIFCDFIQDETKLSERIERVISLSSPFWGTPLLNKDLSVSKSSRLGFANVLIFNSTENLFPVLSDHLAWRLPKNQNKFTVLKYPCENIKTKMVNYGAYLESPFLEQREISETEANEWLLKQLKNTDYKQAWNSLMHYKLSNEIFKEKQSQIYLWNYNDGLVPIYSSLMLNPNINKFNGVTELNAKALASIKHMNPNARLFAGINHSEFTDFSYQEAKNHIKDVLSNKESSISHFIIKDLS
ncbi:MAG: hypothetical protein SFU25_11905 [Candidatus Caenarcaniphilales bacterium]|nr:hypothetical protein [Candidatus Caenarcaniphilales bacterium]